MRKRLQGNKVAGTINGMLEIFDDVTKRQRQRKFLPDDNKEVNAELRKTGWSGKLRGVKALLDSGDSKGALEEMTELREGLERFEKRLDGPKRPKHGR